MNNKGYLTADTSSKADEYYTPENVVAAILPHIPEKVNTIWCPFDGGGAATMLKCCGKRATM